MKRTHIVTILDRSGSMQDAKADHEGGLRSFVEDQKQLDGEVLFTFVQFDTQDPCEIIYDAVPIDSVKSITLIPRGGTPLLDAVGKTLAHVEPKTTPDDQIIVMVITDGEENESREWKKDALAQRVKDLEKKGWAFLFLGANIDAFGEAQSMGMGVNTSMGFANNHVGTQSSYASLTSNVRSARTAYSAGVSMNCANENLNFTVAQRKGAIGTSSQLDAEDAPAITTTLGKPRNPRTKKGI